MQGIFYGVGVGPGDPELMTLKAVRVLAQADVVIAPKTEKKEGSVAFDIAKPYLKKDIQVAYQVFPMVKNFAVDSVDAWEKNTREILSFLQVGKKVVFLTLGDPMFYSTYIYIFQRLTVAGATIETVPGVPAFAAIGAKLGYPVAEGDEILAVIPATAPPTKIKAALQATDNAVLMKVYKNFPAVVELLEQEGMAKDSILVSRLGLPEERCLRDITEGRREKLNYLSTILCRRQRNAADEIGKEE
ncbi:MAG: precorrin-2 C(20)-methyltransferase [Selenomonadaceae bacterium]|nr:precorrin-2 C(20)-methyltransferase [Selenomonadaceae bacterium]